MKTRNSKRRMLITVGIVLIVALAGLMFVGNDGIAATNSDGTMAASSTSAVRPLLKMFSALIVVVIAIYFGIYLLRQMMGKKFSGNRNSHALEVLETTYVGPKKSLSLVRVADRSVLIGVTDQTISMLSELDSEITAALLVETETSEATAGASFSEMFKAVAMKAQVLARKPEKLVRAESR